MNETPHAARRTPHLPSRFAAWLSDRANPMLVRCIRQELRSKTFLGVFVLLLVVSAIAAIASAAASADQVNSQVGRNLFSVLGWAWSLVVVIQAMSTFQSVIRERNEDTWDLLDLTGMGPRPVLRGLLLANLVQGQLYTAALAPFLVMAYLLRGIDLLTIAFALVFVPLAGIAASTLAVFFASIGNNKPARAFFGGLLGLGLTGVWLGSAALWFDLRWLDSFLGTLLIGDLDTCLILGGFFNAWLAFVALMLVLSGALMTHRAGDRSSGPRLLWFAIWINGLLWFTGVGTFYVNSSRGDDELDSLLGVFAIMGVVWAGVLGLFSVSEDVAISPRQARTITQAPRWRQWATLLHGPGATRGRLGFLALLVASVLVGVVGSLMGGTRSFPHDACMGAAFLGCYLCLWLLIGDYLYRGPARAWLDTTALRRGFLLVLLAAVSLGPVLIALVIDAGNLRNSGTASIIGLLSPIMGMTQVMSGSTTRNDAALIAILLAGLAAFGVLLMQGLRLRIATQRIAARQDDRNPRGE